MDILLSTRSIGISDLRESPARAFEQADETAVVVLNHNRPAGYILSTRLMEALLDQAADRLIASKAAARVATVKSARKITLDDL
ncbi:MAG TPA: type II toxin-antitoxin system Phd/YefM family antitoxin [Casimicrobium sp.]|nr:type II toxin-antitoxin system Phd/YefM family antitoxin [Casimicrobium sp.]